MAKTILIATNDPNLIYLLQRYAEESGFQSARASQVKDILDLARRTQPALIILDVELPESVGPQVLCQLRAEPATRNVPLVIYSCLDEPLDDWGEGVNGYLQKSVMYDDFVAMLKHTGAYL
jgi:CheY-like chemotaxis protein